MTGSASNGLGARWPEVEKGWGRWAVEFATLSESAHSREYVTLHHRLDVGAGDRLLDVPCGAGLALELAGLRGAQCAGIDASTRLLAVARDRNPDADLRVGDIRALPWDDDVFDVVTSFRGLGGTTPSAVAEVYRVLIPGGRVGLTVWGDIKASPGAWALAPFALAGASTVENQAATVALARPGAGETLLHTTGFTQIERISIPFVWEFTDPEAYARALASTGPAFEVIQAVGEESFCRTAVEIACERVRAGLPLRAPIAVTGYIAAKSATRVASVDHHAPTLRSTGSRSGFLADPTHTPEADRLFEDDRNGVGYVTNVSRLWAYLPAAMRGFSDLMGRVTTACSLSLRQRSVLVTAAASTLGDSYCSLAWGKKLAKVARADVAAATIRGEYDGLDDTERALARWARLIATDPNAISAGDVQALRDAGLDGAQTSAVTTFIALRLAFSIINDALGALPDRQLASSTPETVVSAVTFGRRPAPDDD